jgi:hypothetical protein
VLAEWLVLTALGADCAPPDCDGGACTTGECAEGACAAPVEPAAVATWLDEAETAFAELDIGTFIARTDAVRAALPCLAAVPPPALVARVHRLEGLRLFGERNVDSVRAFAAARSLAPEYEFPPALVPAGSPILDDWRAMDLAAGAPEQLPEPVEATLFVDGRPSRTRQQNWPALVQLVPAGASAPTWTVYLRHHQDPPAYEAVAPPLPPPVKLEEVPLRPPPRGARAPLLLAFGASAVTTGATYGAAWVTREQWADPDTPDDRLPELRARTNALTTTSAAAGLMTVAFGSALVVTW